MPNFPYTSSMVNMQIMNQFHTHSQKKQNPAKKFIKSSQIEIARRRRRWDHTVKARSVRSSDKRRDQRSRSTRGAIGERACWTIALLVDRAARWSTSALTIAIDEGRDWPARDERPDRRRSLFFLSLSPIWALSFLSPSLSFSLSGNELKWKWERKFISKSNA